MILASGYTRTVRPVSRGEQPPPDPAFPLFSPWYVPRVPPRDGRRQIRVLVGRAGHSALQKRTEEKTGGNVSELIRRVQKYGVTRMRKGWRG
jgi:hypothetical protein